MKTISQLNIKPKPTSRWLAASVCMSAIVASTMLTSTTQAQVPCSSGVGLTHNQSVARARVGDTVFVFARLLQGIDNCSSEKGTNFIVLPNAPGVRHLITAGFMHGCGSPDLDSIYPGGGSLPPGQQAVNPDGVPTGIAPGTTFIWYSHTIAASDLGVKLTASLPRTGNNMAAQTGLDPRKVYLGFMAEQEQIPGQGLCAGTSVTTSDTRPIEILIESPGLTVTKRCIDTCPNTNQINGDVLWGSLITVEASICNTGTVALVNVSLQNTPAGGSTVTIASGITLQPNQCTNIQFTYSVVGNPCGPFTDTVVASGQDALNNLPARTYTASSSATCLLCQTPCISVVKDCIDTEVQAGTPIRYTYTVRNCGNIPLTGVVAVDDNATPGNTADDITTNIGDLAIGATRTVMGSFPTSEQACNTGNTTFTNTVKATGFSACPAPQGPMVMASDDCVARVLCRPCIRITEEVVCVRPDGMCEEFGNNPNDQTNACGFRNESGQDCSAFCFKIIIEAVCIDGTPSRVPATGIQVTSKLNLSTCNFPTTLPPGGMAMCLIPNVTLCTNFTDIVTVTLSDPRYIPDADDTDSVTVVIKPIAVRCTSTFTSSFDMDENPNDNCVTLPAPGPITLTTTIYNDSDVALVVTVANLPPLVECADGVTPKVITQPIPIPARETYVITGCYLSDCSRVNFDITVRGTVDVNTPDRSCVCFYNRLGQPIQTDVGQNDHCPVCADCVQPVTCRTTGGGNLLPGFVDQSCIPVATIIFPSAGVDHISHGGQLGAPFSQMDCGTILGNPCIRGQWEHVRHYQGNGNPRDVVDMNFHTVTPKGVFDSLSCACLGCCDPDTGAFIPPTTGPLIKKFAVCNPDDRKNGCGPMPRPAPANALIFSGIGRITPTDDVSGPRASRSEWVIFRIYIEDRSEPGNGHAGGGVEPTDIYCFQAWKTGIKTTRKPDFTTISTAFRMALGEANCDFLRALETGALPIGTLPSPTVNGLTADIQDCGSLYNGNRQIHPSTGATCDP